MKSFVKSFPKKLVERLDEKLNEKFCKKLVEKLGEKCHDFSAIFVLFVGEKSYENVDKCVKIRRKYK